MSDVAVPTNWKVAPLADLVEILDARRVPLNAKERASRIGSIPYYGAVGQVGVIDRAIFDEDLILLGEDGVQFFNPNKQKAYRISGPAWVNNHAHVLRARSEVNWRFLEHYLNQFNYQGYANGTTRLKLTQAAMRRIPIVYPPLDEQLRVVEILEDHLSHIDAGERLLRSVARRGGLLELAALGLLVPEETPTVSLKEIAVSAGYGTSTKCVVDGPGVPVARIPNVVNGAIDLSEEKRAEDPSVDLSGLMLREGDLLFVRTNGSRDLIGRTAVVQRGIKASFASYLIRYQLDPERVEASWVHYMMRRPQARAEIERLASSSAGQLNLSLAKLDKVRVPLPDLQTQRKLIDAYEASLDGPRCLVARAERAGRQAAQLRRALLAAAFSGKLTGADIDVERAEEMASA
ncbi:restriction endonuclease subunit S [Brachybacterium paraconglomeratum]